MTDLDILDDLRKIIYPYDHMTLHSLQSYSRTVAEMSILTSDVIITSKLSQVLRGSVTLTRDSLILWYTTPTVPQKAALDIVRRATIENLDNIIAELQLKGLL